MTEYSWIDTVSDRRLVRGTRLLFSTEVYSDYHIHGLYMVQKAFVPRDAMGEFAARHPEMYQKDRRGYTYFDACEFISWLVERGLVVKQDYTECFVGSHGDVCFTIRERKSLYE